MGISKNIKDLRIKAGLTQAELADKIGVTRATVTQWEREWSQPRMGAISKLADVFGISVSQMVSDTIRAPNGDMVDVPLYGSIAAGTPIEMLNIDSMQPVPTKVHDKYPDAFLLKVEGESMNHVLPNGCFALIDPCKEVNRDNKPYAVCVNGYDATIKRVRQLANGFQLIPDSDDPTYTTKTYNYNEEGTEQITIIGRVVYYVLPFDWEF